MTYPKVLIVGTVPYNPKSTSRAFESYFANWDNKSLAQIFSNAKKPIKGHCGTLYQITDQRLVKRRLNNQVETGVVYQYDELPDEWENSNPETNSSFFSKLYQMGSHKGSVNYLMRRKLWKEKYWKTSKLDEWLDNFRPDCVFLSFSDDFFIPQIALYAAERFNIPIVSSIGDDYYFNEHFSLSPFYHIYRSSYKKLIHRVFAHGGSAIYIGDKIRDKYNSEFGLDGKTVYLTSQIQRKPFKAINLKAPKITYCGNIRLGRNTSIADIAKLLNTIDPSYKIIVYSNENDPQYSSCLVDTVNIDYRGSVPYSKVQEEIAASDIVIVVEGFLKKDVDITRYSLSTKVADTLASGSFVLAYGSDECGAIEYMKQIDCGLTCTSYNELAENLPKVFADMEFQLEKYNRAIEIVESNHRLESSNALFESVLEKAIYEYRSG